MALTTRALRALSVARCSVLAGGRCAEWVDQNITDMFLKELEEQEYAVCSLVEQVLGAVAMLL